jgi:hypothetical protein
MPRWILALVLFWVVALAAPARAKGDLRPSLLIVPTEARYPVYDRRLAARIETELRAISRFRLLPLPESGAGSTGAKALERGRAIALEAGADAALVLGFLQNPEPQYERVTDVAGHYVTNSQVEFALLDAHGEGTRLRRTLTFHGESPGSSETALQEAMDRVADDVARELRAAYRLHTAIATRQGRHLTLSHGSDAGIQEGMFFTGDPRGGRVRVTKVQARSSEAELLEGYYDLAVGSKLIEQTYVSFPAAAGLFDAEFLTPTPGRLTGLVLGYNRTGFGYGATLTLGQLSQGSATGLGFGAQFEPQREWIPERLWVYGDLGVEVELLGQPIPGTGEHASSQGLHGTLGAGLGGRLGNAEATVGLGYWTPFLADRWNQTTGVIEPVDASARVPHPLLGGFFVEGSATWAF